MGPDWTTWYEALAGQSDVSPKRRPSPTREDDVTYAPGTAGTMGGAAGEGPPVPTGTPEEFPLFILTP